MGKFGQEDITTHLSSPSKSDFARCDKGVSVFANAGIEISYVNLMYRNFSSKKWPLAKLLLYCFYCTYSQKHSMPKCNR